MATFYIKKQCTHCKQTTTFAYIKDDYDAAVTLVDFMNNRAPEGFSFVVESPLKFECKDTGQNEASI